MSRPEIIFDITCTVCSVVHSAADEYANYVCSDCAARGYGEQA